MSVTVTGAKIIVLTNIVHVIIFDTDSWGNTVTYEKIQIKHFSQL